MYVVGMLFVYIVDKPIMILKFFHLAGYTHIGAE